MSIILLVIFFPPCSNTSPTAVCCQIVLFVWNTLDNFKTDATFYEIHSVSPALPLAGCAFTKQGCYVDSLVFSSTRTRDQ